MLRLALEGIVLSNVVIQFAQSFSQNTKIHIRCLTGIMTEVALLIRLEGT